MRYEWSDNSKLLSLKWMPRQLYDGEAHVYVETHKDNLLLPTP